MQLMLSDTEPPKNIDMKIMKVRTDKTFCLTCLQELEQVKLPLNSLYGKTRTWMTEDPHRQQKSYITETLKSLICVSECL